MPKKSKKNKINPKPDKVREAVRGLYLTDPSVHSRVNYYRNTLVENLKEAIESISMDVALYGIGYAEIVERQITEVNGDSVNPTIRSVIRIKPLDPAYIRERRDKKGKLLGYVQTYTFPFVTLKPEEVLRVSRL